MFPLLRVPTAEFDSLERAACPMDDPHTVGPGPFSRGGFTSVLGQTSRFVVCIRRSLDQEHLEILKQEVIDLPACF